MKDKIKKLKESKARQKSKKFVFSKLLNIKSHNDLVITSSLKNYFLMTKKQIKVYKIFISKSAIKSIFANEKLSFFFSAQVTNEEAKFFYYLQLKKIKMLHNLQPVLYCLGYTDKKNKKTLIAVEMVDVD